MCNCSTCSSGVLNYEICAFLRRGFGFVVFVQIYVGMSNNNDNKEIYIILFQLFLGFEMIDSTNNLSTLCL